MTDHSRMSSSDFMPSLERGLGGYVPAINCDVLAFVAKTGETESFKTPAQAKRPSRSPRRRASRFVSQPGDGAPTVGGCRGQRESPEKQVASLRSWIAPHLHTL